MKKGRSARLRQCTGLAVGVTGLALFTTGATTQAAATGAAHEDSGVLEEILVTARRTSESLQQSPVSISALTAEQLDIQGVNSVQDLNNVAPNVVISPLTGGTGKSVLAVIRGVGQNDFLPAFEPGVGFYVNDVYQGTLFGSLLDLSDIDRVEVLRGPQGTLFGKNNEGGAVRIFTPKPKGDGSGYAEVGYGDYRRQQVKGAADFALVPDKLFLRLAAGSNRYDGYVDQIDFVCAHPDQAGTLPRTKPFNQDGDCKVGTLGGDNTQTARADLRWLAAENLEINVAADVTNDKGEPAPETLLAVNTSAAPINSTNGVTWDSRFIPANPYQSYATYTNPADGKTFPRVNDVFYYGLGATVDWDVSSRVHIKNVLGYRGYDGEFTQIWGAAPVHINDNYFKPYHRQLSEELDVSGNVANIDWAAGLYYFKSHTELNANIYLPEFDFQFYGKDPVEDTDKSAFVHAVYHLTPKLGLEGGVRRSNISKTYQFDRQVPTAAGAPAAYLPGFEPSNPKRAPESSTTRFDYRAAVQYQWTDDVMTYVTWATGFKGPGVNPRPNAINMATPFKEESLKSWEVGMKSEWLGNRLRLNLSVYRSDYTDLQLSIPFNDGVAAGSTVSNAGKVRISGVEAELQAEPVRGLLINANVGTLDFKVIDLGLAANIPGGPTLDSKGLNAPKLKYSVGIQYGVNLANAGKITPRLDWNYQGESYSDWASTELGRTDSYGLLNAHLVYDSSDRKWQLALEVKNLTDKMYYIGKFSQYATSGMVVGTPGAPRTTFVTLKRSF